MHYEDDRFHPNAAEDDDLEYEYLHGSAQSITPDDETYSSVSTVRKRQKKNFEDLKSIDKGFHRIKRIVKNVALNIEFYSTSTIPGAQVREAITGARYPQYRVGSLNEHLFFKVGYATGELGKETVIAFFVSPEQYERHSHTVISQEIKSKWTDKCMEIRSKNTA
jgi:hypothetical protein